MLHYNIEHHVISVMLMHDIMNVLLFDCLGLYPNLATNSSSATLSSSEHGSADAVVPDALHTVSGNRGIKSLAFTTCILSCRCCSFKASTE